MVILLEYNEELKAKLDELVEHCKNNTYTSEILEDTLDRVLGEDYYETY